MELAALAKAIRDELNKPCADVPSPSVAAGALLSEKHLLRELLPLPLRRLPAPCGPSMRQR